ncbi:MAG TPA: septum formation initiator family protein, partial [Lachnospiraceae bacterium]|nr:septum formation initiator family protein [Lachnospiraceae bacterium]
TARALRPVEADVSPQKKLSNTVRKNRERASHMNPAYVVFLTLAMLVTGYVCIQYIQLQSNITNSVKQISVLESQLNDLKAENDDTESRIKDSVSLEEIKQRAMDELGMQYAKEDQIVKYDSDDTDYVRQYIDVDE